MLTTRTLIVAAALLLSGILHGATEVRAQAIETAAPYMILIDAASNTVLLEKAADEPVPPASMSKLMTVEIIFNALKEGRVKLDDIFHVSENAWRKGGATSGGSTMFAKLNSDISLSDLIQGIIIQSGNDACIVVAEGMAGTEEAFVTLMNKRAAELGLTNSTFANVTGLPDPSHRMSVRDLAKLARHIIMTYPEYYKYYSQTEFTWNGITQRNRNPLLREAPGADGMKTGYTDESGYGLVGSVVRDDRRVILVMNGLKSIRERAEEARKIIDWSFRAFEQVTIFEDGVAAGEASVYGGEKGRVKLVGKGPIRILLPRTARRKMDARIVYQGPLIAPVDEGKQVAELRVTTEEGVNLAVPLYTGESVGVGTLKQRALDAALDLVTRWW